MKHVLKQTMTAILISIAVSVVYTNTPAFAQGSPIEVISEKCSASFDGFLFNISMTVTIEAKRALEYVSVQGRVGGEDVPGAIDISDPLSAGEQKTFVLFGILFSLPDDRQCGYYFEWLELVSDPDPDPDPDPEPDPEPDPNTDGTCRVGDVLSPGQSCTDPGTGDDFSVLDDGRGQYAFITSGGGINLRGNINGKQRNFSASPQGDGT